MHLQFQWEDDDGEEHCLSYNADVVPRKDDLVRLTYENSEVEEKYTIVSGEVDFVRWDFDNTGVAPMHTFSSRC